MSRISLIGWAGLVVCACLVAYSRYTLAHMPRTSQHEMRRMELYSTPGVQHMEILARASDTNGEYIRVLVGGDEAARTVPGQPLNNQPPFHSHQKETLHVIKGHLAYIVEGVRGDASDGEEVVVPAGAVHKVWNAGLKDGKQLTMTFDLHPGTCNGRDCAGFFEHLAGLSRDYDGLDGVNPFLLLGMFDAYDFQLSAIPAVIRPYVQTTARLIGEILGFQWNYEEYRSAGGVSVDHPLPVQQRSSQKPPQAPPSAAPVTGASHGEL